MVVWCGWVGGWVGGRAGGLVGALAITAASVMAQLRLRWRRVANVLAVNGSEYWGRVLEVEFGGMNEALYNLYSLTGEQAHAGGRAKPPRRARAGCAVYARPPGRPPTHDCPPSPPTCPPT